MRRAFTLVDLTALLAAGVCVLCMAALALGQPEGPAAATLSPAAVKSKNAIHVRAIHQACVVWAQNNADVYPLPSKIDEANYAVSDRGTLKDTTANIYSLLVFCGAISTEVLVSPAEKNANIKVFEKYEFDRPQRAAKPELATWDPGLRVDFTEGQIGGASYAHLQPSGGRLKRWSGTSKTPGMILANRGPEVEKVTQNEDGSVTPTIANPKSVTYSFFGEGKGWSGHAAFNDNHVEFLEGRFGPDTSIARDPKGAKYTDGAMKAWPDVWNFDEVEDLASVNEFLGIFTRAGGKPSEFKAIWD